MTRLQPLENLKLGSRPSKTAGPAGGVFRYTETRGLYCYYSAQKHQQLIMRLSWGAVVGLAACLDGTTAALSDLQVEASHGEIVDAFDMDGWSVSDHILSKNGYRGYFAVTRHFFIVHLLRSL